MKSKIISLRDKILCDQNIYSAIYSIDTSIVEKTLLSKSDIGQLQKLSCKVHADKQYIERIQSRLKKYLDGDELFQVEVYFKFKKIENQNTLYRPIHTADLETQICLIALMNIVMFNDDYNKGIRRLSSISQLLPHNFYGNLPSTQLEHIYKPWAKQYREYTQITIEKSGLYSKNKQYQQEITLDIKNFFPNINPAYVYQWIVSRCQNSYSNEDMEVFKRVLELLLYFEIKNDFSDHELIKYYGWLPKLKNRLFVCGLPQGLVHTYYMANLVMIGIAKFVDKIFQGDAYYYVDDSVVFCNCNPRDFKKKITQLNSELEKFGNSRIPNSVDNQYISFIQKPQQIQIHNEKSKSGICGINESVVKLSNLSILANTASGVTFEIKTSLNDFNDVTVMSEIDALLKAIDKEMQYLDGLEDNKNNSIILYKKRLRSYKKFYLFRRSILLERRQSQERSVLQKLKKEFDIKSVDVLSKKLEEDIFQSLYRLYIKNSPYETEALIEFVAKVENRINFGRQIQENHLYYIKDIGYYSCVVELSQQDNSSYFEGAIRKSDFYQRNKFTSIHQFLQKLILNSDFQKLLEDDDSRKFVFKASNIFQRDIIRAYISVFLNIPIEEKNNYLKRNQRPLFWYELRIIHYLQQPNFNIDKFRAFIKLVLEQVSQGLSIGKVDYNILGILPYFRLYINGHKYNDDLLRVHEYVYNMWKNGSKFLHFFTLHNVEHSLELIKISSNILVSFSYLKLKHDDYYILYLACYLHDIAMVFYPNCYDYDYDKIKITIEGKEQIVDNYFKVDSFFEKKIRNEHQAQSADHILKSDELSFIEPAIRGYVAEVSRAHGFKESEIYGIRSYAKRTLVSLKYLKIVLRIADLLDMSQDRVSQTYLMHAFSNMPEISKFHWLSHLLVKECNLQTDYSLPLSVEGSWLAHKIIKENVTINIKLNTNHNSSHKYGGVCAHVDAERTTSGYKLRIGGFCPFSLTGCPLICRWFQEKNEYLSSELDALCKYLK